MERLKERVAIATTALSTLETALGNDLAAPIERDAAILRFAYSFEATIKAAQLFLVHEGTDLAGPKPIVRASFRSGLLNEAHAERALQMVDDRNLVVHTYNEKLARELVSRLPGHAVVLKLWLDQMRARI